MDVSSITKKNALRGILGLVFFCIAPISAFSQVVVYDRAPFPQDGDYSIFDTSQNWFLTPLCFSGGTTQYGNCQFTNSGFSFTTTVPFSISKIQQYAMYISRMESTTLDVCLDYSCTNVVASSDPTLLPDYSPASIGGDRYIETFYFHGETLASSTTYYVKEETPNTTLYSPYDHNDTPVPLWVVFSAGGEITASTTEYLITACENLVCTVTSPLECIQKALCWAFVPKTDDLPNWGAMKDTLSRKPPFGYVTAIQTQLAGSFASGTPAFALATSSAIQTRIFDPIRSGLTWVLWFCAGVWLYKRTRDINV